MVSVTGAYYIGIFVGVIVSITIYELIKFVREYIKRERKIKMINKPNLLGTAYINLIEVDGE